jgi:hypothetical protein
VLSSAYRTIRAAAMMISIDIRVIREDDGELLFLGCPSGAVALRSRRNGV